MGWGLISGFWVLSIERKKPIDEGTTAPQKTDAPTTTAAIAISFFLSLLMWRRRELNPRPGILSTKHATSLFDYWIFFKLPNQNGYSK